MNDIYIAIAKIGGPTEAAIFLRVNAATVHKWVKKGYIPKLPLAAKLAKASGVSVENLRKQGGRGILTLGRFS